MFHSSITDNPKLETPQMSFNWHTEKEIGAYPYYGMYSAIKWNKLQIHAPTWMNHKSIILSERSQT